MMNDEVKNNELLMMKDELNNSALITRNPSLKKVPEIRFQGFGGEWKEKILENICDVRDGTHTSPQYKPDGFPLITSKNVKNGYINYDDIQYISKTDFDEINKRSKVDANDILIGMIGTIGNIALIREDTGFAIKNVALIKDKNQINYLYSYYFLQSSNTTQQLEDCSSGGTQKFISLNNIRRLLICLPGREEQAAIGDYFQKLDSLISQHQQKHDKLSRIKKAMLERMFPKPGQTTPEIRFKGFSGEWEEKKLGGLAEIVRGASPRPIEDPKWFDKSSAVGWLRIRDVTEQDGRITFLEQRISKLGQEKTRVLFEPHLLLSIAASVGKPVINYVETGVHDGFLIFKKPLFVLEFMYQWLRSFQDAWQQYGQPGSQVNLNSDIAKSQVISIPSNAEQTAIGNYFQKLDSLINQHQQQITKLKHIKQACLSKMFV